MKGILQNSSACAW